MMPDKLPQHRARKPDTAKASAEARERQRTRFLRTDSAQWRAIRKAQLERFPLCEDCNGPANEVDHNTNDTRRNLIGVELSSLCKPCHSVRTRARQRGIAPRIRGCDVTGRPLDPEHPWNKKSLEGDALPHAAHPPRTPPRIEVAKK